MDFDAFGESHPKVIIQGTKRFLEILTLHESNYSSIRHTGIVLSDFRFQISDFRFQKSDF